MPAKRRRAARSAEAGMVSNAAEAVGKALGNAVSAIESVVGARRRRPNGYQKLKGRGQQAATAADRPARSRSRKSSAGSKRKTEARRRTARSPARKTR